MKRQKAVQTLNSLMPKVLATLIVIAVVVAILRATIKEKKEPSELEYLVPREERHFILPLNNPAGMPTSDARHLEPDDLVLGVLTSAGNKAYPWWLLAGSKVVNDTIGDIPVLVTINKISSGSSAFIAEIAELNGETSLTFQECSGEYNHLLCDHQSNSRWHPFRGTPIEGRLTGLKLPRLTTLIMTWADWSRHFPNSQVAFGQRNLFVTGEPNNERYHFGRSNLEPTTLGSHQPFADNRLAANEVVVGLIPHQGLEALAVPHKYFGGHTATPFKFEEQAFLGVHINNYSSLIFSLKDLPFEGWSFASSTLEIKQGEQRWSIQGEPLTEGTPRLIRLDSYVIEFDEWSRAWPETDIQGSHLNTSPQEEDL